MARQIHHGTDGFLLLGWTLGCLIATWPLPVDAEEGLFRNATGGREGRPGMELRLFRPAIDSKGYFNVNASPTLPHLNLSFGLVLDYALGVGRLEEIRDINTALVRHGLWGTLHFNVGLFNWAVIGLQLPVGVAFGSERGTSLLSGDISATRQQGWSAQAIGDLAIHGKVRLLRLGRYPLGLAVVTQLQFMTGRPEFGLGDPGEFGLTACWVQAVVDGEPAPFFRWALNLGYRAVVAQGPSLNLPGGERFTYDDQLTFSAAASFPVIPRQLDVVTEIVGNTTIGSAFDWYAGGVPLEAVAGIKVFLERSSYLYLGAGTGIFSPGYSAPALRAFAAWVFEPSMGDRDRDGVRDDQDECPDEPEDFDDFEDSDGCPDPDNDGDGVLDVEDRCPMTPEDLDDFEDDDGCPDPDNDRDRIADSDDECPLEKEIYNGEADHDGCPDVGPVDYRDQSLIIMEAIHFATDSAEILPTSFAILDAVAATIIGNPQITLVEVQGHADERASDEYNLRLTSDRAASVVSYLTERGRVPSERLRAAGYGERCPVASGHDAAAWEANRRVEFKVIRTTSGPTGVAVACPAARDLIPRD